MPNELDPRIEAACQAFDIAECAFEQYKSEWPAGYRDDFVHQLRTCMKAALTAADAAKSKKSLDEIIASLPDHDAPPSKERTEIPMPVMDAVAIAFAKLGIAPNVDVMFPVGAAAMDAAEFSSWRATHRHRKGGLYRIIAHGLIESDKTPAVIYEAEDGTTWVRPKAEFFDGRFTPIDDDDSIHLLRGDCFWPEGEAEAGERTPEKAVNWYFEMGDLAPPTVVGIDRGIALPTSYAAVHKKDGDALTITWHSTPAEAEAALAAKEPSHVE